VYPNPFNPATTLQFSLPVPAHVELTIYNVQGQRVVSLIDKNMNAGTHISTFDGATFSSGLYFAKLQAGDFTKTSKLLLVK
jgi:hypothetical protein